MATARDANPEASLYVSLSMNMEMEQTFNWLAAIVQGRPVSLDSIPTTAEFCASLLILREFMHHLNFTSINVRP